jgi:hypothetical protein
MGSFRRGVCSRTFFKVSITTHWVNADCYIDCLAYCRFQSELMTCALGTTTNPLPFLNKVVIKPKEIRTKHLRGVHTNHYSTCPSLKIIQSNKNNSVFSRQFKLFPVCPQVPRTLIYRRLIFVFIRRIF